MRRFRKRGGDRPPQPAPPGQPGQPNPSSGPPEQSGPPRRRGRRRGSRPPRPNGDGGGEAKRPWYKEYFPATRPREARGGIKAQNKRGDFGESWWAKRWVSVLESFRIASRLKRGQAYARKGQVLNIDIAKGKVTARVQGSRPEPYNVVIRVKLLSNKDWAKLARTLIGQARFTAKLLAGEMPADIEQVFQSVRLSLFPQKRGDLQTACSCPDWSNPCKHVAAVYYLIGEEFDRDPFLIFQLRGLTRDELFAQLHRQTTRHRHAPPPAETQTPDTDLLPADPKQYWAPLNVPDDVYGDVEKPPVTAAWPKRLGNFPFWRGHELFLDALEEVYADAAQRGLEVFQGVRKTGEEE